MPSVYGSQAERALDLNLLRVLVAVSDAGSVTKAAAQLYLTQPAVSAALRRLTTTVGAPLLARHGRGVVLTERGARLVADVRPHLEGMLTAALAPPKFDPMTSDRTLRIGLSDIADEWLLPPLLRLLRKEAPHMRIICIPVQFRTIGDALADRRVDIAVTVADELPPSIARRPLFRGGYVCVFDPRHTRIGKRLTEKVYFAHDHVIVSYNGDLRGFVEDSLGRERSVRCSVATFASVGAVVEGSALLATVPEIVARRILELRPRLRSVPFPFVRVVGGPDLLWPSALEADDACIFMRDALVRVAKALTSA